MRRSIRTRLRPAAVRGLSARLLRDQDGLSAIEFALIAPLMILIYLGLVELSQGYMAERRASHVAAMVADLVAQSGGTNVQDLDSTFLIGDMIMRPFSSATLSTRVSSITVNARGVATVEWTRAKSARGAPALPARKRGDAVTDLPAGLITDGQTVILGETYYGYSPSSTQLIPGGVVFKRRYYLRPRTTDRILCSDC